MSASQALQKAVYARLAGSATLMALVGDDGIGDRLATGATLPRVTIVSIDSRDWSTGTEGGEEHMLTLAVQSGEGGHRTVQQIAGILRGLLHDVALALESAALVSLFHRTTKVRRDVKARGHVAELVFRAVTE